MKFAMGAVFLLVVPQASWAQGTPPEPTTIVGKCNKEVGGRYDWGRKQWVIPQRLIAAKNACVTRMLQGGR
jgi:hypothetical protein